MTRPDPTVEAISNDPIDAVERFQIIRLFSISETRMRPDGGTKTGVVQ
jgi:hypothetical protein